ncbi:MAG TPA: hypothetical protein VN282_18535 [Pyrinomonadaceae bacterium]|nr:hypothetical protein [Pyrinomonadaceae bacterium]
MEGKRRTDESLLRALDWAHMVYLGLLPVVATFSLLYSYGHIAPFLLFLAGTAAVSVYLAATYVYTPRPRNVALALFVLLDGPAWAALSLLLKYERPLAFAVNGFLIDGTAVWASILVLALRSDLPTHGQRWASVGIMAVALAATYSLAWPYCRDVLQGSWGGASLLLLALGAAQGALTRYRLYERENTVRDDDASAVFIVVFIFAWLASLIAGNVLHEVSRRP